MRRLLGRFARDERGAAGTEYCVLVEVAEIPRLLRGPGELRPPPTDAQAGASPPIYRAVERAD